MKGQFCFCEKGLPEEPYASMYLIVTRCCEFLDGKPYGEPEYRTSRARYEGKGIWSELSEFECLLDPEDMDYDPYLLVSAGMDVVFDLNPEYFEIGGSADLKRGIDVVAYCPLPDVPDLSKLKPMEVK